MTVWNAGPSRMPGSSTGPLCLFCAACADKTIKFWEWAVTTEQQQSQEDADPTNHPAKKHKKKHKQDEGTPAAAGPVVQRLGFQLTRQLEMAEDVLCVKVSPDGKLLAASLLDHTIKVYYVDRCGLTVRGQGVSCVTDFASGVMYRVAQAMSWFVQLSLIAAVF